MYQVYILYSEILDIFYKGQTDDLSKRVERHNQRTEKATAPGAPWILLWSVSKESRSEAVILERKLKNLSRIKLIKLMKKYSEGIRGPDVLLALEQKSGC